MEKKKIKELLSRYSKGQCSAIEKAWVEALYDQLIANSSDDLTNNIVQDDLKDIYQQLADMQKPQRAIPWMRLTAAAVFLVFISIGLYFYLQTSTSNPHSSLNQHIQASAAEFAPGGNKATLTLSDGSTIALDDAAEGKIKERDGIEITKNKDGLISYKVSANTKDSESNTLTTPKGGQYQLILADGTKIWLNAASSITYPTSFNEKERRVTLKGEGYFEIAKNEQLPFKVITEGQEVEVLGTHFNINSYEDESDTKTTLLEGSVKVSDLQTKQSILLKPGEQATLRKNGKINVGQVNAENAIAWKSGFFQFQNSDVQQAMRQLSRWYDVDIEFEDQAPNVKLWGEIHRNATAIEALEILSYFDLKYKVVNEGKTKKIIIIQ